MRPYAWSDITITAGAPEIPSDERLAVEIRTAGDGQTRLTVRKRRSRETLLQLPGVVSVQATAKRAFTVTFDSGATIDLLKPKNCGCGGAR